MAPQDLIDVVKAAGYGAGLPALPATAESPAAAGGEGPVGEEERHVRPLRDRLIASAVLTVPVVVLSMVPAAQFRFWRWPAFALARHGGPDEQRGLQPLTGC